MNATQILKSVGLKPDDTIFAITQSGALNAFLDFIEEWELPIKIDKISKEDWETLFASYADAIIDYHPEDDNQERAVFLKNKQMLKKYGLTDEYARLLDFC
ncbi:hypothetical protein A3H03_00330 [Candidatus Kuenenbacteria bacterium RIFCSPLOWO2_12_FULL_42_13]|uniref:Uncharacterized protein n=1 Tax=Candidatus Kuenenbacteria bacterium RIFCSPLOWO2_12_FULL_42_13 TaxID=1798565 RepID=A0A1F6FZX6_9BACT|nr:MAG: hypothetical protein A3H03_00330 [Candidatus Kuenenbacteria bacterium RIFCSPLOWO2_12_FULL_42_13]